MAPDTVALDTLNGLDEAGFAQALDGVFEHAPWVAAGAARLRPFATIAELHERMMQLVRERPKAEQIAFLNLHPELGGQAAKAGKVTRESAAEQAGVGIDQVTGTVAAELDLLNARYRERFGFPFIICVRRQTRAAVRLALQRRLANDAAEEVATALAEIAHITRLRIVDRVSGPGAPKVAGRLSTHVLDTHAGLPAQGVRIALYERGEAAARIADAVTNAEGRTDAPLLGGGPLRIGRYELVFEIGAYFQARGIAVSDHPFLDDVAIRFGIDDPEGHYHVPLVATPWSYATYHGS